MIEQIKNIRESLALSNKAIVSLNSSINDVHEKFLIIDGCFNNEFFLQRTAIDQLSSNLAIARYHNERLQFVAQKLIRNPKLIDEDVSVKLIDELSLVDASLQDGKFGRPVEGVIFPKIATQIIQILDESQQLDNLGKWQEWQLFFEEYQIKLKQLIVLFPIQYPISSLLYTLYYGLRAVTKEIEDQVKLEATINALSEKTVTSDLNEHSSYFRLHIKRLQRKQINPPVISSSTGNQEDNFDTSIFYADTETEPKLKARIKQRIKKHLDKYLLGKIDLGLIDKNNSFNLSIYTAEEE